MVDASRANTVLSRSAEIRVVHNDERRLTHTMTVEGPDYEIVNVNRYDTSIDVADWVRFTLRARVTFLGH